ncbi:MAG: DEAD/DEAH box helicase [Bacteroidales bacterium]
MDRSDFFYDKFLKQLQFKPTSCQDNLLKQTASFITCDSSDVLVVNGYAGTGKTTAIASVITALSALKVKTLLMAPTGRAAKVLEAFAHKPSHTILKQIYRQKSVSSEGFGQFTLAPNKEKDTLFIVDEVSLIGVDNSKQGSLASFGTGNLLEDLIEFVRSGTDCRLIMLGDSAQLPPIGLDSSPALSKDYMDGFGGTLYCELTDVVRQQKESGILLNATALREKITQLTQSGESMALSDLNLRTEGYDDIVRIKGGDLIEAISDAYSKYGEDETIVLCRSNKRANRYNAGIRSTVQYKEERLVKDDKLMIVKNCYQFLEKAKGIDYIANGDITKLERIYNFEDRYGLHFADADLCFPDYDSLEIKAKVILDTLESESASLTYEQQNALYNGVSEDYSAIKSKKKRYDAVREDHYYNALQLKYANAITAHKSQGGQWKCVFIDNPFWQDELTAEDLKWLYTALTRATEKVYLINFKEQ